MSQRAMLYGGAALGAALVARSIVRRARRYDVRDKVVAITGGSRGLGFLLARELVAMGARVAICARDDDELARAANDLAARGGHVLAVPCDVTDEGDVARFVTAVRIGLGPIDVVINNAGVIDVGPMANMTLEDYQRTMATHFWGPLTLILAVLPEMRARRDGRIVNIASIGGKIAVPHLLPYTASKFALVGLSEGMRAELALDGVWVTTVVPGLMRTGSARYAMFKGQEDAERAWFAASASNPLTSMRAERAARQIIAAMRRGDPEVVLSMQAKVATKLNGVAPRLTQRVLGLVNRFLPHPIGDSPRRRTMARASRTPSSAAETMPPA